VPVGVVPRQTRDLKPHHDARTAHAHIRHQTSKAFPPGGRRSRLALITIDHDDPVVSPAQCGGTGPKGVLTLGAFDVLNDLPHRRLPDVKVRIALEVVRLNLE